MTFHHTPSHRHPRAPFGLFHNFDTPQESTGYVFIHLFSRRFGVTWERA